MIIHFNEEKDKNFYVPSVAGPQSYIPHGGNNHGADTKIKTFKEFEIGEYRKGSSTYGNLINRIMEFLRLPEFKVKLEENDGLKFEISDFEKRTHINVDDIKKLLNDDHNLYNFDIIITKDNHILFNNIKNTFKGRTVLGF